MPAATLISEPLPQAWQRLQRSDFHILLVGDLSVFDVVR